jgi:DNA-binding transcriptional LysR family regulator
MLNYNHLNYFHVAATEGTLAAAASRLGVTQPLLKRARRVSCALFVSRRKSSMNE